MDTPTPETTPNGVLLTPELLAEIDKTMSVLTRLKLAHAERELSEASRLHAQANSECEALFKRRAELTQRIHGLRKLLKEENANHEPMCLCRRCVQHMPVLDQLMRDAYWYDKGPVDFFLAMERADKLDNTPAQAVRS